MSSMFSCLAQFSVLETAEVHLPQADSLAGQTENLQLEHTPSLLKKCCILPAFKPKDTFNQCVKICFRRTTGNLQATIVQAGQVQSRSCCLNHESSLSLASAFFSSAKRNICYSMLKSHLIQLVLASTTSWKMHCLQYLPSSPPIASSIIYKNSIKKLHERERQHHQRDAKVCNAIMKHKQNQAQQHSFCRRTNPSFMMVCC